MPGVGGTMIHPFYVRLGGSHVRWFKQVHNFHTNSDNIVLYIFFIVKWRFFIVQHNIFLINTRAFQKIREFY